MEGFDVIRALVLWIHAIAAVAWVGGSLFYLVVLRPALIKAEVAEKALEIAINRGFKEVVDISIISLVVTGAFITFDRLSSGPISLLYFIVLGAKLASAVAMFLMARQLGSRSSRMARAGSRSAGTARSPATEPSLRVVPGHAGAVRRWLSTSRMVLALGLSTFFLSMVLARVYEHGIRSMV